MTSYDSTSRKNPSHPATSRGRTHFTCTVCTSDHPHPSHLVEGNPICLSCLRSLFEHSLTNDHNFPPRWARRVLDHSDFERVLGEDLTDRLEERWREHVCPVTERVYCRLRDPPDGRDECGAFLGRRGTADRQICRRCRRCEHYTCLSCLSCLEGFPDAEGARGRELEMRIRHLCEPAREAREEESGEVEEAFAGLQRGRDYQDCPDCGQRVQLADGCNHITCPCGGSFCYICGDGAQEYGEHWNRRPGACPRYGQPSDGPLFYSDDIEYVGESDGDTAYHSSDGVEHDNRRWELPRMLEEQDRRQRQRAEDQFGRRRGFAYDLAQAHRHAGQPGADDEEDYHQFLRGGWQSRVNYASSWSERDQRRFYRRANNETADEGPSQYPLRHQQDRRQHYVNREVDPFGDDWHYDNTRPGANEGYDRTAQAPGSVDRDSYPESYRNVVPELSRPPSQPRSHRNYRHFTERPSNRADRPEDWRAHPGRFGWRANLGRFEQQAEAGSENHPVCRRHHPEYDLQMRNAFLRDAVRVHDRRRQRNAQNGRIGRLHGDTATELDMIRRCRRQSNGRHSLVESPQLSTSLRPSQAQIHRNAYPSSRLGRENQGLSGHIWRFCQRLGEEIFEEISVQRAT